MATPDLNLLLTLDAVLTEGSVTRAAERLHLSPSAMSRALARLRDTTGDPLLVRAGRGLVPTPRALELRERVTRLVQEAEDVLRPSSALDLPTLARTFTVRARTGFVENFGAALLARVRAQAPGVRLRFVPKENRASTALRDATADVEVGVVGHSTSPEVRVHALFRDRFVGVVRAGHALSHGEVTPARYVHGAHVSVSRRGQERGPIDDALAALGLDREVAVVVSEFSTALALTRATDLIATVPERQTGHLRAGLHSFAVPHLTPEVTVSLLWHPRMDADPAHRWFRQLIGQVCAPPAS
ncbi:LysR family transcriptional regulator [Deinococcus maricopensis]|uniref:Transcriptional regulator, LysR family n=1 Tax=Deinococcus maricopensis (strain DSM 21211 / LMG 22137 / NRRL B-23946 / LB-34) TaxID=709986 RepID=E8U7N6_DEIML|nr:LysR family transcriptional regulator [Deinococcus maricopensis]ADV67075.1 transcriptional regulator, LysR family [Deinococcus maricopensis DSM 21211]